MSTAASDLTTSRPFPRWRTVAYWGATGVVAWEMTAGSFWDLERIEYVRVIMAHLGYPPYVLTVIGACKLPCALALLAPGFPRLKEWAYAGAFINYYGATASHLLSGDGPSRWAGPLVFAAITLASWALRPPARKLPAAEPASRREWLVTGAVAAAMIVASLLTLPKGPPPGY